MNNLIYKFLILLFTVFLTCCEQEQRNELSDDQSKNIPTREKVEYVFACMQGNEDSQAYVAKCSCSIDYIDDQMTYDDYVEAETIMSLRQIYGEKSVMFRNTPNAMEIYSNMQNLLAEAEMECF